MIAVLAVLWAWPSALFLPVLLGLGQDSPPQWAASIAITLILGLVVALVARYLWTGSSGRTRSIAWALIACLIIASAIVVPAYLLGVESGVFSGLGGDRGQVLEVAWLRISDGIYPYTYVNANGGTISSFPGSLLLAAPAVLLTGNAGFMTLYLAPIAVLVLARVHLVAGAIAALSLLLAPAFWMDALSRGDLVTTSMFVFAMAAATMAAGLRERPTLATWLWPIGLGLGASTRLPNIALLLFVAAFVFAAGRRRVAITQLAIAVGAYIVVTGPLYLMNPGEFSPLTAQLDHSGGNAGRLGVALMFLAMLGLALGARPWRRWPVPAALALVVSIFAILLTTIPMVAEFTFGGVFRSGYSVLALAAPIAIMGLSGPPTSRDHGRLPDDLLRAAP